MKNRIFIAMHYMELGGAETSLIGLLHSFDYSKYDVDLFLYAHRGELMKLIPKNVNLLPEIKKYSLLEAPLILTLKKGCFDILFARICAKLKYKQYLKRNRLKTSASIFQFVEDATIKFLPSIIDKEYDLAISYQSPHRVIIEKVKAKKKLAWIHTDYDAIDINIKRETEIWSKYDYILSISEDVTKSFLHKFPALSKKIILMENILSANLIKSRAQENISSFKKGISLLSVGRFAYPKNFDNIPQICKRVRELGLDVYWFLIGYGGGESLIRQRIKEEGMEEYVIIIGKKENPYPYIMQCDYYIQPSKYEGKSIAVREAQILGKPVIITNYPTAHSQINDHVDGVIVPLDNEGCANGIVDFIKNKDLVENISLNVKQTNFSNEDEIEKIYKLIQ